MHFSGDELYIYYRLLQALSLVVIDCVEGVCALAVAECGLMLSRLTAVRPRKSQHAYNACKHSLRVGPIFYRAQLSVPVDGRWICRSTVFFWGDGGVLELSLALTTDWFDFSRRSLEWWDFLHRRLLWFRRDLVSPSASVGWAGWGARSWLALTSMAVRRCGSAVCPCRPCDWLPWILFSCVRMLARVEALPMFSLRSAPVSVSSHRYGMLFCLHRFVLCDSVDFLGSVAATCFFPICQLLCRTLLFDVVNHMRGG
jgi:hypothetical protein